MAASLLFFIFAHDDSSDSIIEPDDQHEMPANKYSPFRDFCKLKYFEALKPWQEDLPMTPGKDYPCM